MQLVCTWYLSNDTNASAMQISSRPQSLSPLHTKFRSQFVVEAGQSSQLGPPPCAANVSRAGKAQAIAFGRCKKPPTHEFKFDDQTTSCSQIPGVRSSSPPAPPLLLPAVAPTPPAATPPAPPSPCSAEPPLARPATPVCGACPPCALAPPVSGVTRGVPAVPPAPKLTVGGAWSNSARPPQLQTQLNAITTHTPRLSRVSRTGER